MNRQLKHHCAWCRPPHTFVNDNRLELVERIEELHTAYEDGGLIEVAVVYFMLSAEVALSDTGSSSDDTEASRVQHAAEHILRKHTWRTHGQAARQ